MFGPNSVAATGIFEPIHPATIDGGPNDIVSSAAVDRNERHVAADLSWTGHIGPIVIVVLVHDEVRPVAEGDGR